MIAHGANPDAVSEEDYQLVMVALHDGLFGNKALSHINAALTTGVFNYIRPANAKAYEIKDTIGTMHDYVFRPLSEIEQQELANSRLLAFMSMRPGAPEVLNGNNGDLRV